MYINWLSCMFQTGTLLLSQIFSEERIVRIKCHTYMRPRHIADVETVRKLYHYITPGLLKDRLISASNCYSLISLPIFCLVSTYLQTHEYLEATSHNNFTISVCICTLENIFYFLSRHIVFCSCFLQHFLLFFLQLCICIVSNDVSPHVLVIGS